MPKREKKYQCQQRDLNLKVSRIKYNAGVHPIYIYNYYVLLQYTGPRPTFIVGLDVSFYLLLYLDCYAPLIILGQLKWINLKKPKNIFLGIPILRQKREPPETGDPRAGDSMVDGELLKSSHLDCCCGIFMSSYIVYFFLNNINAFETGL